MRPFFFLALLPATAVLAQTPVTINLEPFASGLQGIVDIAHAGDERLFAVLQPGSIRIVNPDGTVLPTPFLDITDSVNSGGEQGLLGLAFDPNYAENGFFYVNYIYGANAGNTRISRFQVSSDPNVADSLSDQVIWTWPQPYSNHNGGDLDFGPDGLLYIPLGDGGGGGDGDNNAQTLSNPLGDIVRIDVSDPDTTYTIPLTNPWVGVSGDTLPEIWASGLRNPFRFGFDALTGDLWLGDVGQNAYEEVDFWPAGDNSGPNFGWRCYEGDTPYNTEGCLTASEYVVPVAVHPQNQQNWCSVMGGRVYRGSVSQRLYGRYIYTDYCGGQFYSLHPDGQGGWVRQEVRPNGQSGYTCVAENSALELFVGGNGAIQRIVDPCPMDAPVVTQEGDLFASSEIDANQWYLNGEPIPGATGQVYVADASGAYYVVVEMAEGCELASETIDHIWTSISSPDIPGISVHPVPASDRLLVEGLTAEVATMAVIDVAGRTVFSERTNGQPRLVVYVSDIATGHYTLVLGNAQGRLLAQRPVSVQH